MFPEPSVLAVALRDRSYGARLPEAAIGAGTSVTWQVDVKPNQGWYDFSVDADKLPYRYFGRLETGEWSISDPAMG
jgi:hypothetical protein